MDQIFKEIRLLISSLAQRFNQLLAVREESSWAGFLEALSTASQHLETETSDNSRTGHTYQNSSGHWHPRSCSRALWPVPPPGLECVTRSF